MTFECDCEDWEPGMKELNKHLGLWSTHNWTGAYYEYKTFVFCPWCGKRLKENKSYRRIQ